MVGLHNNQKRILDYLLDHPEGATLDELIPFLGVTKTAVKQHVDRVVDLGYVAFQDIAGGMGRPKRKYFLSPEGIEAFPKKYSWLSSVILTQLTREFDRDGVVRFMTDLADSVAESVQGQFSNIDPTLRFKRITELLNELGYRASLRKSAKDEAVIEAVNCVYHSVAKEHPELCRFDTRLIEKTSGMSVKLESCIARGGSVCRFCIKSTSAMGARKSRQ